MMIHWGAPYIRALRGIYLLIHPSTQKKREREKKSEIIVESCPNVSKECLFHYQPIGLPIRSNYYLILNCAVVNKNYLNALSFL